MPEEPLGGLPDSLFDRDAFAVADRLLDAFPESGGFEDFGAYRIERLIGRGGMAEVYLAWEETAERWVALKFLRRACTEPDLRERFAREIRTLAKLEHPLIARLYEAGVHPNGTPYFAMEYVEGKPIDESCRERASPIEERLRLFRSVCEAVQYAHSHLVVHRDLKPSNIFVKEDGAPKLLDFGIAKQLENLDQTANQTRTALRFTRAFAAPEQLRGEPVGVFTDVYSLGVILYELLTGRPPYELSQCSPMEADLIITSARDPVKPSAVAELKNGSKAAWNDLDLLCLTAMNKQVAGRYASTLELAQEIDRFLNREPLKARPATRRYRIAKFVSRNRTPVFAALLVFALIAGLTSWFTLRLARARDRALAEAARTQRVERFMLNLFDSGDKEEGPANDLRVITLLDRGAHETRSLNNEPVVQAELYQTLGGMYRKLGRLDRAEQLLNAALEKNKSVFGSNGEQVAGSVLALGLLRIDQARLNDAERLIHEAITMNRRLPPDAPEVARDTAALGLVLDERGQYEQATQVLSEAVRLQSAPAGVKSDLAGSLSDLSDAHFYLGQYAQADSLSRQALALHRQLHGEAHPLVANDLVNLGHIQVQWGHYIEAERYYRRALEISQTWYGKDHPETARDATYVAQALASQNRYREAEALLEGTLATLEQTYGKMHPRVALVLNQLGMVAAQLGNLDEAATDFRQTADIYKAVYGERHQLTAVALNNLATMYLKQGQYVRAEALFRDVIVRFTAAQSANHMNTGVARIKLGRTLVKEERYADALSETHAGYEILSTQTSPSVSWLVEARRDLVKEYESLGEPEKATQFRTTPEVSVGTQARRN